MQGQGGSTGVQEGALKGREGALGEPGSLCMTNNVQGAEGLEHLAQCLLAQGGYPLCAQARKKGVFMPMGSACGKVLGV